MSRKKTTKTTTPKTTITIVVEIDDEATTSIHEVYNELDGYVPYGARIVKAEAIIPARPARTVKLT